MSVADQSVSLANASGRVPFTVRFSPQFVNRMCDRLQKTTPSRADVAGLLFGRSEQDVTDIQVFKSFPEADAGPALDADKLSGIVESLIASSHKDPEVSALSLIGWYSFRPTGGLHENDVAFHNRYFRHPNEVAVILRPEQHPNVLFEIYSKSGTTALSEGEHRWGALRHATDTTVAGPIDVTMRAKIGDDFYLRAYQVSKTLDRAERREQWISAVEATKSTMRSIFRPNPKQSFKLNAAGADRATDGLGKEPALPATPLARAAAASAVETPVAPIPPVKRVTAPSPQPVESVNSKAVATQSARERETMPARNVSASQKIRAGDPPALPAVIKPPRRGVPWISSVIVFAVAAGITFALYVQGIASNGGAPGFLRAIFPDTGLGLRVEGQGERVLLSWNRRNALVRSSQGGVLHIDDGPQHRDVRLDPAQIANGSVLYRPGSDDVSFRLEVHGQQGAAIAETMRVLDGAKAPPLEVKNAPPPDVSAPASTSAPSTPTTVIATTDARPARREPTATTSPVPARQSLTSAPLASSAIPQGSAPENRLEVPHETIPQPAVTAPSTNPTAAPPTERLGQTTDALTTSRPPQTSPPPAGSESHPVSTPPQTLSETPHPTDKSTLPNASGRQPEAARLPTDTAKVSNWEEAGRNAEPAQQNAPQIPSPATSLVRPSESVAAPVFVPPKPMKKVLPDLRSAGIGTITSSSQVEIAVRVNKKGHVTEAFLVGNDGKVPQYLTRAALSAAKQWTFQPATLRGKTVPSDHTIVFEFRPSSR